MHYSNFVMEELVGLSPFPENDQTGSAVWSFLGDLR